MQALSYFSILVLGVVLAFAIKATPRSLWGKPLLTCYTIVIGLFAIYYLLPGALLLFVTDGHYVWLPFYGGHRSIALTGLAATVGLLLFLSGYALRSRRLQPTPSIAVPVKPDPLAIQIAWTMVAMGIALKLYVVMASGGVEMTILRHSGGVRESLRIDEVSAFLTRFWFLSSMADAGITWLLIRRMQLKRSFWMLLGLFLLITALSYMGSGKRLYILWPLLAVSFGYHFYVRPLRIRHLPLAAVVVLGLGFLTLMFRIYAPASAANVEIDLYSVPWAEGSLLRFYFMSLEFASFELLTLAMENPEAIVRQFGSAWDAFVATNIEPFAYFVPRELWPGKPEAIVDIAHANRVVMQGGTLTYGHGVNSMLLGTSWTFAGPLGLAIAMTLLGWFSAAADNMRGIRGVPSPLMIFAYAFATVTVFHLFRQGTIAWTAFIVVLQHSGLVLSFGLLFLVDFARPGLRTPAQQISRRLA